MAGCRNSESDSSDSDSLKDEDFIPPESPPIQAPPSGSDSTTVEDFSTPATYLIPPPPYSGSDSLREEDLSLPIPPVISREMHPIPPPPGFRSVFDPWPITETSDAPWRSMSSMLYMRPVPCNVAPYLSMGVAPPGQPMYRYLTLDSEGQGMYVYSPIPSIEYPQVTSDAHGYLTIPFITWLSNSPIVTNTINALGSIPAPYLLGYEGIINSGRVYITSPAIGTIMEPTRGRGRGRGGRCITRRLSMFIGPVSRPWTRYSSDLNSTISKLSFHAITLRTEFEPTESQEEKESVASCISGDSTPEPLEPTESTTKNIMSDVTTDTNSNQTSVIQPTESPLNLGGPINVDQRSEHSISDSGDPQPGPLTRITPDETTTDATDNRALSTNTQSSSTCLKQSNNGKKPGLIGSKGITQNPGPSREAETEPTKPKPLKLYDFFSPKLREALVGNVSEMAPEKQPSSLENVNSSPTLEIDSAVQWPRLALKPRLIPQREMHMHFQWPTIGLVRRAARSAIALQEQLLDEIPPTDHENPALDTEMASLQVQMPPELDNLAFLTLFAAEVWPELPPGDPEQMDLILRILREKWLLLDPEDRQSLARLAALVAWPQRPESTKPD